MGPFSCHPFEIYACSLVKPPPRGDGERQYKPSIPSPIEGIVYDAGDGHQQAIKHLLEADNMQPLVNLLIQAGIFDMLRQQAEKKSLETAQVWGEGP